MSVLTIVLMVIVHCSDNSIHKNSLKTANTGAVLGAETKVRVARCGTCSENQFSFPYVSLLQTQKKSCLALGGKDTVFLLTR